MIIIDCSDMFGTEVTEI